MDFFRYKKCIFVLRCVMILLITVFLIVWITDILQHLKIPAESEETAKPQEYTYTTIKQETSQDNWVQMESSGAYLYKICAYHDLISVFLEGHDIPYLQLEIKVSDLPYEDQLLLKNGIYVDSKSELIRVLQDYDG